MRYEKTFEIAVQNVLRHEGGYVNHPNDPGGETNFGITKRSYPDLDIKNLTRDQAIEIYYEDWWLKYNINRVHNVLAIQVLKFAVNMGASRAVKILQKGLNICGAELKVDGLIGKNTIEASYNYIPYVVELQIQKQAELYYRELVKKNPKLKVFLRGWINRVYK